MIGLEYSKSQTMMSERCKQWFTVISNVHHSQTITTVAVTGMSHSQASFFTAFITSVSNFHHVNRVLCPEDCNKYEQAANLPHMFHCCLHCFLKHTLDSFFLSIVTNSAIRQLQQEPSLNLYILIITKL
jgi:adenosylmethionine-8-amino-7-oxononanoate aminotransferase